MTEINEEVASQGRCGAVDSATGEVCMREAGEGIDQFVRRGRCIEHTKRGSGNGSPDRNAMAGNQRAVGNNGGPPKGSQNALKHGLYADLDLLETNLDADTREWVNKHTADLATEWERATEQSSSERFRHERLRPIALMRLIQTQGFADVFEHGLLTTVERTETFTDKDGEQHEGVATVQIPRRVSRETLRLSRRITDALGDLRLLAGVENEPDPADDPWATASYELAYAPDSEGSSDGRR